jgi:hypothetical protein
MPMENVLFLKEVKEKCSIEMQQLMETFESGRNHLLGMFQALDLPWEPEKPDLRELHNNYIQLLVSVYTSKFSLLSDSIIHAINRNDFLTYALSGRSLIECVATLRYYVSSKYKPLFDKGWISAHDMDELIKIDHKHLCGTRFDWESFFFKRYDKLKDDVIAKLKLQNKKGDRESISKGNRIQRDQTNIITYIQKWAKVTPEVMIVYDLFCDLVHPNIGSNFLVASIRGDKLHFGSSSGEPMGLIFFQQSFPMFLSVIYKPFGEYLKELLFMTWQKDEINSSIVKAYH